MPLYNPGGAALSGTATGIEFSGSGVSSSIDANNILQVNVSGGLPVVSGSTLLGFVNYLKFDGSAVAGGAFSAGTGTITVNAGAGGSVNVNVTGVLLGAATTINFVGTGATASFAGGVASVTLSAGGAPGGLTTYTTGVYILGGSSGTREGHFDICHSALTTGSRVFIFQSAEPGGLGKGTRPDEAQMDLIVFKAQKVNPALTCTVHWAAASPVSGAFNLDWFVG
jgi:hypothetical protein